MAIHLRGLPGERPFSETGRAARLPRLALLRVGFTEPAGSPPPLVRSYRTLSPLPVRARRPAIGGFLSVALSCGSPRLAVSQHPALRSPDLPRHDPACGPCRGHPADSPSPSIVPPPAHATVTARPVGRVSAMSGGARQLFDPEAPPLAAAAGAARDRTGGGRLRPRAPPRHASRRPLHRRASTTRSRARSARPSPATGQLWVRGEIAHLSDHRSGHLYLDLVDPDDDRRRPGSRGRGGVPTLSVKCWRTSWAPLAAHAGQGRASSWPRAWSWSCAARIDLYRAKGEISLILAEVDVTAFLGRLAAQRARLLRTLEAEGLLRAQRARCRCPRSPLHVGLVASPGTEGCRDFLGQLTGSGFGFRVSHVKVPVQGPARRRPSPVP